MDANDIYYDSEDIDDFRKSRNKIMIDFNKLRKQNEEKARMKKNKKKGTSLKDRLNKSYENKDKGGGGRPSAMDWKKVENVKFYKPKEGKNKINIIPYKTKTKNDPLVASGDCKIGEESYMLDLFIHTSIGPTQSDVICLKENFHKKCPICDQRQEFYDQGKKAEASALKPKRQCFYNVIDEDNSEEGLQVFNISHFLFEKELIEEARAASDDGDIVDFVDIEDGKMVCFRGSKTTSTINDKSVTFLEYKSFSFKNRSEALDPDLVEQAISFDELMIVHTPEEIETILYGEEESDEDEKPIKSSKKATPKKKSIDNDEDDDDEEDDEEDEEEDYDEDDDESDDDTDEEDEEEEDDEDEDSDDEDDDDYEPPTKKPIKKPIKAPIKKPLKKKK